MKERNMNEESMNEEKYVNHLKKKIDNYLNLSNDQLNVNYIKAIISASSFNLFDSIFLLLQTYNESTKSKKTKNSLQIFTDELVKDKKKFIISSNENVLKKKTKKEEVEEEEKKERKEKKEKKEEVEEEDKKEKKEKQKNNDAYYANKFKGQTEHILKNVKSKQKNKDKSNEKNEKNEEINNQLIENNVISTQHEKSRISTKILEWNILDKEEKKLKKEQNDNARENKKKKENEKEPYKSVKVVRYETKEESVRKVIKEEKEKKEEREGINGMIKEYVVEETIEEGAEENFDYFSHYINLENTSSLKYVIGLIEEGESVKRDICEKKNKYIDICICNGKNHKLYANCLICGKVYCTKMKYTNCIYCEATLYEYSIFDKIYLKTNISDKNVQKIIQDITKSDMAMYHMYFNYNNKTLQNAFDVRQRMLNNSLDDNQTRVIDDSTDWFEVDIATEMKSEATSFRFYDDDIKNEIIEKYYQVFDQKYTNINVNIDLENLSFKENEDYSKVKELKEYLKKVEKEYIRNLKRERNVGQLSNPSKYMTEKEETTIGYLSDLRAILFKKGNEKKEKKSKQKMENKINEQKGKDKKKKYNVLNPINAEDVEEEEEEEEEIGM